MTPRYHQRLPPPYGAAPSAFDLGVSYGNVWTSIASGFKTVGTAVGTGAKTVGTAVGTGAKRTASAWQSLDPQTQAFLLESGQTAVAQALAARQQRLAEAQLAQQASQQQALAMAASQPTGGAAPSWLLPAALLGGFGLIAAMIMRRPGP